MCTYSMMADNWFKPYIPAPNDWPKPQPWPYIPNPNFVPSKDLTPEIAKKMLEVLKKVEEIDKKISTCPCHFDKKQKKSLVARLKKKAKGAE